MLALAASCSSERDELDAQLADVEQHVIGDNDDDGVLDGVDLDDDNDGILDQTECETPTLAATDFWTIFNPNFSAAGRRDILVAGAAGTQVSIAGAAPQAIPASGLLVVDTGLTRVPTPGVVESGKAIRITASARVQVFANNFQGATVDAFSVVPASRLGTEYRAIGYPNSSTSPSQVSVYAVQDNTSVTIGATNVTLNAGQSYLREAVGDATGLSITADKPVGVNAGDKCLSTPLGNCDHLEEMLFPISGWSSEFYVPPIPQSQAYRVVAGTANTTVSVDGVIVATLQPGQFFTGLGGAVRVRTSSPSQVYIVALGELLGDGDPELIGLAGSERGLTAATFSALAADNLNTVTLSMPTAAIGSLRLDGAPVVAVWLPYLVGGYSYTTFAVSSGVHRLTATQPFLPIIYGDKLFESYGYVPGFGGAPGSCDTDTDGDGQVDTFDRDADGDTVNDVVEAGGLDVNNDGRADGVTGPNGVPLSAGAGLTPPNTDGQGGPDPLDTDSDNDGVLDGPDTNRTNANLCRDQDLDTCDDCSITGANNSGGSVSNDGPDFDGDGACNAGDGDDDNDGAPDAADSNDANPNVCSDTDLDGCEDCISGTYNPAADGPDFDGDGRCNGGDLDDDNDGSPDAVDSDDGNPNVCSDIDGDSCDDCSGGTFNPAGDGADNDGDGQCNAGDPDDDNDGSLDPNDSNDGNPNVCSDTDADTCEDCISGVYAPGADGPDFDLDGRCNAGDPDDDNDGSLDPADSNDANPFVCSDTDADTCEDCVTGTFNPAGDGPDNDSDGRCNNGDTDDDNDGALDPADSDDGNPNVCSDNDGDTCDDCSTGTYGPNNDGPDNDGDGACNAGDGDDDNDGAADPVDSNDSNPNVCSDVDTDTCDDCSTGTYGPNNDGPDNDGDGACNAGDTDDDNDGSLDPNDSNDNNPNVCSDVDTDSCDDCSSGTYGPNNDGPDADGDGACNAGDTDDDNDGVPDGTDNCGVVSNPTQANHDGDAQGDACDLDDDNDQLNDADEQTIGSDPLDADSDDDGLVDGSETTPGADSDGDGLANVFDTDADNDGIFDGTERGIATATADTDVSAGHFYPDADPNSTTDPADADTDNGGRRDGLEDSNHNGAIDPGETNPNLAADDAGAPLDSDGDGLSNAEELAIGTNPNDADSDDDGVRDGDEANFSSDTDGDGLINALDPDSDNDGLYDGTERGVTVPPVGTDVTRGHFIPDAGPTTTTNPLLPDTDHGGLADGLEDINHNGRVDLGERNPNNPLDDVLPILDGDGDGLTDAVEVLIGTNPADADSDDDGVRDGLEANYADDTDGDGQINALDWDADGDALFDGTELGITAAGPGTDVSRGRFIADADPSTRTSMVNADTDRGGVPDGIEDTNRNGRVDAGETNPNNPADDNPSGDADGDTISDLEEGTVDSDGDGTPDFRDTDSDNDGIGDANEAGDANVTTPAVDTDGDGTADFRDSDSDGDFLADSEEAGDANPATPPRDSDSDGTPDYRDLDTDGDTISDADEAGDTNLSSPAADTDGDETPDYRDLDTDGDTISDAFEAGDADLATPPVNTDGMDQPDWRDVDSDNDGVPDGTDNCRRVANPGQEDGNEDGVGDACQGDSDGDDVGNEQDNCPTVPNPDQRNSDGDAQGDVCDADDDNDGVPDGGDNCPLVGNPDQTNTDGDANGGDACDGDDDNDGVGDGNDNCPLVANPSQEDTDDDGMGDVCDTLETDDDNDSLPNTRDNCPGTSNPDQMDGDGDGSGDACDLDDDNDGFEDGVEVMGGGCSAGPLGGGSSLALLGVALVLAARRRRRGGAGRTSRADMTLLVLIGAFGALALAARPAAAQNEMVVEERDFPAERFQLSTSRDGILNVESATIRSLYAWDVHLWLGDANDPLTLTRTDENGDSERVGSLVRNRLGGELGGSMVVLPYLSVSLDLPMVLSQDRDSMVPGVSTMLGSINSVGLGDLRLAPKLRILSRARAGVDLAVRGQLTVPTGDASDYRGEDGVTFQPAVLVSGRMGALRWAADLGYLIRKETSVGALNVDDEVRLHGGVAYRVIQPLELGVSASLATAANDLFGTAARNYSEVAGGPSVEVMDRFVVFAAAGAGLQNGYGTPDWRALAGLRVGRLGAEGDDDPDRDGLRGNKDACPNVAEDRDGWKDDDGCPDTDNDGDQIADGDDKCPMAAEDLDAFEDGDGCPDKDNDGDGRFDADDKCPNEPETANGFEDDDGCPDEADSDGDGVKDPRDACVSEAEDLDGFEDGDGCPELDNDKDGVADATDRCPLVVGVADNGGCPDTDRDGDAVVDRLDNCPDIKGVLKHQGCKGPQLVVITSTQIMLLDAVYFQTNRDIIQKRSFRLLDNVAAVVNAHPEVTKMVVEGHTDAQGDDAHNQALSQRRAESVVAYLVRRGVDPQRLVAKGFGETRPIADNATKQGRATNRRVDFKLEEIVPPQVTVVPADGAAATGTPAMAPTTPAAPAAQPATPANAPVTSPGKAPGK